MREVTIVKVRKWHEPETRIVVTGEGISQEITLDDFLKALRAEIGSVTWVFGDAKFDEKFNAALKRVMESF